MSLLLREAIGDTIRRARTARRRTLRDVSSAARVSLGYLSEVERGRKEPSSELLAAICEALSLPLPDLLDDVADAMRPAPVTPVLPARLVGAGRRAPAAVADLDEELRSAVEEAMEGAEAVGPDVVEGAEAIDALEAVESLAAGGAPTLLPKERVGGGEAGVYEPATPQGDGDVVEGAEGVDGITVRLVPMVTVGPMSGPVVCSAA